ncbi:MAG: hypothetical protein ACOY7L_21550 [Pseudomonadota bacterium]
MTSLLQLIFVVIATNAGGEGKTMLAQLLKALWTIAGHPAETLDADAGNRAATSADKTVRQVGWGVQPEIAPKIVEALQGNHSILDLGANALASKREISDLVPALRDQFAAAGYRCIALMPISTNKLAAGGSVLDLAKALDDFETIHVRVNRDSSGNYDPAFNPPECVDLGHLQPGFQQYIRDVGGSMAQAVLDPPPGYRIAASHVAHWMLAFVQQPMIADLLGPRAAQVILQAYPDTPQGLSFAVRRLSDATDDALVENARKTAIVHAIQREGWTADGLREVAAMLDAGAI